MIEATWCDKCSGYRADGSFGWASSMPAPLCYCGSTSNQQGSTSNQQVQTQRILIQPLIDLGAGIAQGDMTIVRKVNEIIAYLNSK